MKTLLFILMLAVLPVGAAMARADDTTISKPGDRLWLIMDAAYESRSCWENIQGVARAAIRALVPGDRVRLVVAKRTAPSVLLLERAADDENIRSEVIQTLDRVTPGSAPACDLAKALAVPLTVMEKAESPNFCDLVLLLTSGRIEDASARAVLEVHDKLVAAGSQVVVTGAGQDSSPVLLLAAARGRLAWRELSGFDPGEWIEACRQPAKPASVPAPVLQEEVQGTPTSLGNAPAAPAGQREGSANAHKDVAPDSVSATPSSPPAPPTTAAPEVVTVPVPPEEGSQAQRKVFEFRIAVTAPRENVAEVAARPAPPAAGVAAPREDAGLLPAPASRPLSLGESAEALPAALPPPPAEPAPATQPTEVPQAPTRQLVEARAAPERLPAPAAQLMTAAPQETPSTVSAPEAAMAAKPAPLPPARLRRSWSSYWYIWGAPALIALLVIGVVVRDLARAKHQERNSVLGSQFNDRPCELVARVNGIERVLGRSESLQRFHVGSGPTNTLRIPEEGVEERHLQFMRDRAGTWTLQNLSQGPVEVNGSPVSPGKSAVVDFPAALTLAEHVALTLFMRPLPAASEAAVPQTPDTVGSSGNG